MEVVFITIAVIAAFVLVFYIIFSASKKKKINHFLSGEEKEILEKNVPFYSELDNEKKAVFEERVAHFLATTRITGVNTEVELLDRILIAASAIIPIFGFPDWEYINLHEVLLYPDSFDESFNQVGENRDRLGVVGDGPYQNIMILSKHEVRQGFLNRTGKENTAIHEFVHLIDKTDGAVDGIPEFLLNKQYLMPWLRLMRNKIQEIIKEKSDINPYGATSEAEFFAVVSEYFFERPDLLQNNHPELYDLLTKIFKQKL